MKKIFIFLFVLFALSCDDGNFDIPLFQFSNESISNCGNLVLFKINENETLVIEINEDNTADSFFKEIKDKTYPLSANGSNTITYRTLESNPKGSYFCQNIPPTTPAVINEWLGSGILKVTTILESEDDNDDVLAEFEDRDGDGDLTNDDTDSDAIPDYLDSDDDNDGISTKEEDPDPNRDGDLSDAKDTDGDGIPNYLDMDDDGDGTLTINESLKEDADLDGIEDYLDADSSIPLDEPRSNLTNTYFENYLTSFTIELLTLTNENGNPIQHDSYDFGSKSEAKKITN